MIRDTGRRCTAALDKLLTIFRFLFLCWITSGLQVSEPSATLRTFDTGNSGVVKVSSSALYKQSIPESQFTIWVYITFPCGDCVYSSTDRFVAAQSRGAENVKATKRTPAEVQSRNQPFEANPSSQILGLQYVSDMSYSGNSSTN